jgi:hypothetical protein
MTIATITGMRRRSAATAKMRISSDGPMFLTPASLPDPITAVAIDSRGSRE